MIVWTEVNFCHIAKYPQYAGSRKQQVVIAHSLPGYERRQGALGGEAKH